MKVLIIDDEPMMRQVLRRALGGYPFEISEAGDGKTAIDLVKSEKIELVFLDVRLSDMDGAEILVELKRLQPDIKVITLSGFADEDIADALARLGANERLTKPFRIDQLKLTIEKVISGTEVSPSSESDQVHGAAMKRSAKRKVPVVIPVLLAAACLAAVYLIYPRGRVKTTFYVLQPKNISSLAVWRDVLYISDWSEQSVYSYKISKEMKPLRIYRLEGGQPTGIATDGTNLWVADSLQGMLLLYDLTAPASKDALIPVKSFSAPGPAPSSLFYDGKNLWSCDSDSRKIYSHDVGTLKVFKSYDLPSPSHCGLTKVKGSFYIADSKSNKIFKLASDDFALEKILAFPEYEKQTEKIVAFGSDDKSFWSATEGGKVYRHNPSELKALLK